MKLFNMHLFALILVGLLVPFFSSCEKEGAQGPAGKDGNANVKSVTFFVEPSDWRKVDGSYYYTKNITAITNQIVGLGDVRVYVKATNSKAYQALPYTWFNFSVMRYWYDTGEVEIEQRYEDSNAKITDTHFFKVVIIEGGLLASSVNYNNYEEVADYYNLEEAK